MMRQCKIHIANFTSSSSQEVDDCCENACNDNPKELEPVKERDAYEFWIPKVVERRPEHGNERDEQQ